MGKRIFAAAASERGRTDLRQLSDLRSAKRRSRRLRTERFSPGSHQAQTRSEQFLSTKLEYRANGAPGRERRLKQFGPRRVSLECIGRIIDLKSSIERLMWGSNKRYFHMKLIGITLLAVVVLSSSSRATEKSRDLWWPQFRGPNSSGIGTGKPPVDVGPEKNVQWKTPVGAGLSFPIIWTDRIFLTEFEPAGQKFATLCIDRRTGKMLWRREVAVEKVEKVHRISSPAGSTPATDGQRVYVYFGSYGILCYELDGDLKWE